MATTARAQEDFAGSSRKPRRVRAVGHAIDVLDVMAASGCALGVSEIARRAGLSKPTVHHLLATLEDRRFVMRESESPRYRLSWALYELGTCVVRNVDLSRVARPYLDRLAAHTGESTLLGILDNEAVLYLDRAEPPHGVQMRADAGRRGPLHATASGKALLAHLPDGDRNRLLAGPLQAFSETTITDVRVLEHQLDEVRSRGYATCWQEREIGLCSVAVLLRDFTGTVVGALALAGSTEQLNNRNVEAHMLPLRNIAHQIELHLGGARPRRSED